MWLCVLDFGLFCVGIFENFVCGGGDKILVVFIIGYGVMLSKFIKIVGNDGCCIIEGYFSFICYCWGLC